MAGRGLLSFAALSFCVFVMMVDPRPAYGLNRGSVGLTSSATDDPPMIGICAAAVVVHGYKCQGFEVQTQDGYILSLQRIPNGRAGGGGKNKQPVLLQHGVLVDGMQWFLNLPEQNLPFVLAESGFDVWIANSRGTRNSRRHASLNASKPEYWNWSWNELVSYDLPATVDFVYRQTGQKIDYVGHSLGTLIALASFSEGKLVDKVKSAALLSPIAYLSHMTTLLADTAAKAFVGEIGTAFGAVEFNPGRKAIFKFVTSLCNHTGVNCYDELSIITGKNSYLNASTIDLFLKYAPQSTSTKNMVHLAQTVRDRVVAKYNYVNADLNVKHYGKAKPPVYNLSNIPHDLPLFLSHGGLDALSDDRDVELLLDNLKFHDADKITVQYIKNYAHLDFVMGFTAKDIVYNAIIAFFKSH